MTLGDFFTERSARSSLPVGLAVFIVRPSEHLRVRDSGTSIVVVNFNRHVTNSLCIDAYNESQRTGRRDLRVAPSRNRTVSEGC